MDSGPLTSNAEEEVQVKDLKGISNSAPLLSDLIKGLFVNDKQSCESVGSRLNFARRSHKKLLRSLGVAGTMNNDGTICFRKLQQEFLKDGIYLCGDYNIGSFYMIRDLLTNDYDEYNLESEIISSKVLDHVRALVGEDLRRGEYSVSRKVRKLWGMLREIDSILMVLDNRESRQHLIERMEDIEDEFCLEVRQGNVYHYWSPCSRYVVCGDITLYVDRMSGSAYYITTDGVRNVRDCLSRVVNTLTVCDLCSDDRTTLPCSTDMLDLYLGLVSDGVRVGFKYYKVMKTWEALIQSIIMERENDPLRNVTGFCKDVLDEMRSEMGDAVWGKLISVVSGLSVRGIYELRYMYSMFPSPHCSVHTAAFKQFRSITSSIGCFLPGSTSPIEAYIRVRIYNGWLERHKKKVPMIAHPVGTREVASAIAESRKIDRRAFEYSDDDALMICFDKIHILPIIMDLESAWNDKAASLNLHETVASLQYSNNIGSSFDRRFVKMVNDEGDRDCEQMVRDLVESGMPQSERVILKNHKESEIRDVARLISFLTRFNRDCVAYLNGVMKKEVFPLFPEISMGNDFKRGKESLFNTLTINDDHGMKLLMRARTIIADIQSWMASFRDTVLGNCLGPFDELLGFWEGAGPFAKLLSAFTDSVSICSSNIYCPRSEESTLMSLGYPASAAPDGMLQTIGTIITIAAALITYEKANLFVKALAQGDNNTLIDTIPIVDSTTNGVIDEKKMAECTGLLIQELEFNYGRVGLKVKRIETLTSNKLQDHGKNTACGGIMLTKLLKTACTMGSTPPEDIYSICDQIEGKSTVAMAASEHCDDIVVVQTLYIMNVLFLIRKYLDAFSVTLDYEKALTDFCVLSSEKVQPLLENQLDFDEQFITDVIVSTSAGQQLGMMPGVSLIQLLMKGGSDHTSERFDFLCLVASHTSDKMMRSSILRCLNIPIDFEGAEVKLCENPHSLNIRGHERFNLPIKAERTNSVRECLRKSKSIMLKSCSESTPEMTKKSCEILARSRPLSPLVMSRMKESDLKTVMATIINGISTNATVSAIGGEKASSRVLKKGSKIDREFLSYCFHRTRCVPEIRKKWLRRPSDAVASLRRASFGSELRNLTYPSPICYYQIDRIGVHRGDWRGEEMPLVILSDGGKMLSEIGPYRPFYGTETKSKQEVRYGKIIQKATFSKPFKLSELIGFAIERGSNMHKLVNKQISQVTDVDPDLLSGIKDGGCGAVSHRLKIREESNDCCPIISPNALSRMKVDGEVMRSYRNKTENRSTNVNIFSQQVVSSMLALCYLTNSNKGKIGKTVYVATRRGCFIDKMIWGVDEECPEISESDVNEFPIVELPEFLKLKQEDFYLRPTAALTVLKAEDDFLHNHSDSFITGIGEYSRIHAGKLIGSPKVSVSSGLVRDPDKMIIGYFVGLMADSMRQVSWRTSNWKDTLSNFKATMIRNISAQSQCFDLLVNIGKVRERSEICTKIFEKITHYPNRKNNIKSLLVRSAISLANFVFSDQRGTDIARQKGNCNVYVYTFNQVADKSEWLASLLCSISSQLLLHMSQCQEHLMGREEKVEIWMSCIDKMREIERSGEEDEPEKALDEFLAAIEANLGMKVTIHLSHDYVNHIDNMCDGVDDMDLSAVKQIFLDGYSVHEESRRLTGPEEWDGLKYPSMFFSKSMVLNDKRVELPSKLPSQRSIVNSLVSQSAKLDCEVTSSGLKIIEIIWLVKMVFPKEVDLLFIGEGAGGLMKDVLSNLNYKRVFFNTLIDPCDYDQSRPLSEFWPCGATGLRNRKEMRECVDLIIETGGDFFSKEYLDSLKKIIESNRSGAPLIVFCDMEGMRDHPEHIRMNFIRSFCESCGASLSTTKTYLTDDVDVGRIKSRGSVFFRSRMSNLNSAEVYMLSVAEEEMLEKVVDSINRSGLWRNYFKLEIDEERENYEEYVREVMVDPSEGIVDHVISEISPMKVRFDSYHDFVKVTSQCLIYLLTGPSSARSETLRMREKIDLVCIDLVISQCSESHSIQSFIDNLYREVYQEYGFFITTGKRKMVALARGSRMFRTRTPAGVTRFARVLSSTITSPLVKLITKLLMHREYAPRMRQELEESVVFIEREFERVSGTRLGSRGWAKPVGDWSNG